LVTGEMTAEDLKEKLKTAIDDKLKNLKDQVFLDVVQGGVRIQIVDLEGRPMFPSGSSLPNAKCKQILSVISGNIIDTNNKIAVEGHTDSAPFKGSGMTNWELSTGRASAARKELQSNGINSERIARVVGYADTELLVKDDPMDARNRRISIILLSSGKTVPQQVPTSPSQTSESTKADQLQPLPIIPPSVVPVPLPGPAIEKIEARKAKAHEGRSSNDKDKRKIVDPGIRPEKPIDVRPSIFPGLDN